MSDKVLRYLIAAAITMLLIYQGTLISGIFGMVRGIVSAVVVAAVSFLSARLAIAGGKNSPWFLVPTLLFTIVPIVLKTWSTLMENTSWFDRLSGVAPFILGFGAPVILLLLVYYELRRRTMNH